MNQVMTIFLVLGVLVYSVESSLTPFVSDSPREICRKSFFPSIFLVKCQTPATTNHRVISATLRT
uniref:Acrorhagin 1 n=1 Tax=Actinia equina TaxID=6106 RepID=A0A6C0WWP6_ACTEQ|nr:acrorhagin 1 [Actinia equina]